MAYDPSIHHRRSIRLKGYDYTQPGPRFAVHVAIKKINPMATCSARAGSYFVTIVTQNRADIFGDIVAGEMRLNGCGEIARAEWIKTAETCPREAGGRREIALDEFIVMPNHIHAIVTVMDGDNDFIVGARRRRAPTMIEQFGKPIPGSIPTIIRAYKSAVTTRINQIRGTPGAPVWQRNYWERIIRGECELAHIREYIRRNPMLWMYKIDRSSS